MQTERGQAGHHHQPPASPSDGRTTAANALTQREQASILWDFPAPGNLFERPGMGKLERLPGRYGLQWHSGWVVRVVMALV